MQRIKAYLSVFLILTIIATGIFINDNQVSAAGRPHYESAPVPYEYYKPTNADYYKSLCKPSAGLHELPKLPNSTEYVPPMNDGNYPLNYRLWVQKGLVVYGTPAMFGKSQTNRFKKGYQIHHPGDEKPTQYYDDGYYLKDGVRGEYQYHGFDVSNNPFSNMDFINDANFTTFNGRKWIKEPWDENNWLKTGLMQNSIYNLAADRVTTDSSFIRKWIGDAIKGWSPEWNRDGAPAVPYITDFKYINDPSEVQYDYDVYKYLYVQSPPTIMQAGQGRMWHQRPINVYYQSLTIPIQTVKLHPLVECNITADAYDIDFYESTLDRPFTLNVNVKGILHDENVFTGTPDEQAAKQTVYYNRKDVAYWNFKITYLGKEITFTERTSDFGSNERLHTFPIKITNRDIQSGFTITAEVQPVYLNKKLGNKDSDSLYIGGGSPLEDPEPIEDILVVLPTLEINNNIPDIAFDNIPFSPSDSTDMSLVTSKEVYVGGSRVDYNLFFSGMYVFPRTTDKNGYMTHVEVVYNLDKEAILEGVTNPMAREAIEGMVETVFKSVDVVYVYPTKPYAHFSLSSNSWKENRIINVHNNSPNANIQLVIDRFPIVQYRWYYGGDMSKLHYGTNTDLQKQLQYSKAGQYSITLEARNTLGQWSDPYACEFTVLEDYAPVIEVNLNNSVITRQDTISAWHYALTSTDGDRVSSARIELWYDKDDNGTVDTKLREWNGFGNNGILEKDDFPTYTPDKLGYYVYRIYANEEFEGVVGQDCLSQFVSASDKKTAYYEIEWWVDNFQPLADIYIDAPIERPKVDFFIMLDKNLADTRRQTVMNERVNYDNYLLGQNIIPNIDIWDMKTYTYSQPASTNHTTGESYPPATLLYESNGYSGTLNRTSVSDNGGERDFGQYKPSTKEKSVSSSASQSGSVCFGCTPGGVEPDHKNEGKPYSDSEGYSGWMSCSYSYRDSSGGYCTKHQPPRPITNFTRSWSWSGTAYKTVDVWVPDYRWVSNYTGTYAGTIYKDVRQPYTDPYQGDSLKFILYLSDNTVSELPDLSMAKSKADEKLILAGQAGIKAQSTHDLYIDVSGKTVAQVMDEALDYIAESCPDIEQYYVLQGQTFNLNFAEFDLEGDAIIDSELQYVHERNYFDNPTGQEANTLTAFNPDSGWTDTVRNRFNNVGKYRIFRRVKDLPDGDIGSGYSYLSGATEVNIFVHRKPVAEAELNWTYNGTTGQCETIWADKSYDLDHTSLPNKGIVERKIMFRRNGGEWQYYIPATLIYGTYDVQYYVKDMEGVWSEPWLKTFTLNTDPQFRASLRPESPLFTLNSIPASEVLQAYNLWTRQPSQVRLEFSITPTVSGLPATKTVTFQAGVTGTQSGQDIEWVNQTLQIPPTFPDGPRTFTALVRDIGSGAVTSIPFNVNIFTPINIVPGIAGSTLITNQVSAITASTSKYPSSTTVQLQAGTPYASSVMNMNGTLMGESKSWSVNYTVPNTVPDGTYTARFVSTNPSSKQEVKTCSYTVTRNRPPSVTINGTSPSYIYEGDDVSLNITVNDPDLNTLNCQVSIRKGPDVVWTGTTTVNPSGGTYPLLSLPTIQNISTGEYLAQVIVTDSYNAADSAQRVFAVNALSIDGAVSHTADWEINRQKYNLAAVQVGRPTRPVDTYFAGEKYMLTAATSVIDPRSSVTVQNVTVAIQGVGYSTVLTSSGTWTYSGSLWREEMMGWTDRIVDFVFTATFSNGTVKTDTVRTNIIDDEYWRLHRLF